MSDNTGKQASLDEIVDQSKQEADTSDAPESDWSKSKIEDITEELITGNRPTGGGHDDGEYISIGGTQVNSEGYIELDDLVYVPEDYFEKVSDTQLRKHDILVVKDGANTGDVALAWEDNPEIVTNEHLFTIRTSEDVNSPYVFYYLQSHEGWRQMKGTITGSAQAGINRGFTGKIDIELPPLSEQQKIASVLYNIDKGIRKTGEIIKKTERVKKGVVQDVFRYGLRENNSFRTEEELQESYLGKFPKEWELSQISDICVEVVDCPHSTPDYEEDTDKGILVARTSEIENGRFTQEEAPRVTEEEYKERISRLEPEPGDIIFTREAPIGEAFKIPEGMKICLGQRVMILRPDQDTLLSDYLLELIYSDIMQNWFERSARGTTSTHMNVGDVEELEIPLPDIEEQRRITSVLNNYREKIENEMRFQERLKHLKDGLMQDLLTSEVRTIGRDIDILPEIENHG